MLSFVSFACCSVCTSCFTQWKGPRLRPQIRARHDSSHTGSRWTTACSSPRRASFSPSLPSSCKWADAQRSLISHKHNWSGRLVSAAAPLWCSRVRFSVPVIQRSFVYRKHNLVPLGSICHLSLYIVAIAVLQVYTFVFFSSSVSKPAYYFCFATIVCRKRNVVAGEGLQLGKPHICCCALYAFTTCS